MRRGVGVQGGGRCSAAAVSTDWTSSSSTKLSVRMLPCQRTRSGSTCPGSGRMAVARVDSPWSRTTLPTIGRALVSSACAGTHGGSISIDGYPVGSSESVPSSGRWAVLWRPAHGHARRRGPRQWHRGGLELPPWTRRRRERPVAQ